MSANRTPNVHTNRRRHSRRLSTGHPNFGARHRKLAQHLSVESTRLTAIGGVTSVTDAEILGAYDGIQPASARRVRAVTTSAQVTALGIDIA